MKTTQPERNCAIVWSRRGMRYFLCGGLNPHSNNGLHSKLLAMRANDVCRVDLYSFFSLLVGRLRLHLQSVLCHFFDSCLLYVFHCLSVYNCQLSSSCWGVWRKLNYFPNLMTTWLLEMGRKTSVECFLFVLRSKETIYVERVYLFIISCLLIWPCRLLAFFCFERNCLDERISLEDDYNQEVCHIKCNKLYVALMGLLWRWCIIAH